MIQHELQRDGDRIAIIRAQLRKQFGYNYHALPDTCTQTDQYHIKFVIIIMLQQYIVSLRYF